MKKNLVMTLVLFFALFSGVLAQNKVLKGVVTSEEDGLPLPGVTITVEGTTIGTITAADGTYTLTVPPDSRFLNFSFVGMRAQQQMISGATTYDAVMVGDDQSLDEVVVTALGIKKEKKQVTYAVQNVNTDELTKAREVNVINSLAGKVAGLDMVKGSGGVGSATRVILRGTRSITGNNQPLYVIDGVPALGGTNGGPSSEYGGYPSFSSISTLNPDDIETITILKGANAAAIYGSSAQNGAIIITTKTGKGARGIGVDFSSSFSMETPMILTKYQHEYGQGSGGNYIKNSEFEWGPKMTGQMVEHWSPDPNWAGDSQYKFEAHPNDLKNFFDTGLNLANTVAITTGNEKTQAYASYTNTQSKGIVPGNELRRNNFNVRLNSQLSKKLSADAKLTYTKQEVDNKVATGDAFYNPMRALYRQPSNIALSEAKEHYQYYDNDGNLLQHYWNPHSNGGENVYWMLNNTGTFDNSDRIQALASLKYEFFPGLSLMIRSSYSRALGWNKRFLYTDTYTIADNGYYSTAHSNSWNWGNEFLLNYNNVFADVISVDVSLGGKLSSGSWNGVSANVGNGLLRANLFAIANSANKGASDYGGKSKKNSLYGFATIGFKDWLYLDITGRNDWSSTLPSTSWSYFYPSAGLTWIITDMLNTSKSSWLTFAKLRGSYAVVGSAAGWAQLDLNYYFGAGGNNGYAWVSSTLPAQDLKPEQTHSLEFGADVRFFNNRLGIDATIYKTNTFNQLLRIPVPVASGFQNKYINAGDMQNEGFELTLNGSPIRGRNFSWDISINYAHNVNTAIKISDDLTEYTIRGRSWMTTIKVVEGEPMGQIYTKGFLRSDDGQILINGTNGLPMVTPGQTMPMGNANPDWIGGMSNNFKYKKLSLGIVIDTRMGGQIFSFTEANLASDGFSDYTLEGRDGMIVEGVIPTYNEAGDIISTTPNTVETNAEAYWQSLGGRNTPTGEPFGYDASYVRLREVVLSYPIMFKSSSVIRSIQISAYGRNLGFLYNAAGVIDPGMNIGTGNIQGMEGFGIPTTKQYGLNLKFSF
ncbi:MAG: SusC/RagA family TonB-linked outer membrane protein [Bacteroidetes bacterium]|nr:MAG: SusC/RagA family TonB-linked outer membrane protein [Bacteroidota bacterium]